MVAGSLLECSIHAEMEKYQFPDSATCFPGDHPFGDFVCLFVCPPTCRLGRPSLSGPCLWVLEPPSTKSVQLVHHFLCAGVISFMTGTWFMVFFYLEHMGSGGHVGEEILTRPTQRRSWGPGLVLVL